MAACRSWAVSMAAACSASSASAVARCASRTGAGSGVRPRITPVCAGEIAPSDSARAVAGSTAGSGWPSSQVRGPRASAALTRSLAWPRVNISVADSSDAVSR